MIRDITLSLKINAVEAAQLDQLILKSNFKKADYLRAAILKNKVAAPHKKPTDLKKIQLINQIAKIGNNFNQMQKVLNIANLQGTLRDVDFEDLLLILSAIEDRLSDLK